MRLWKRVLSAIVFAVLPMVSIASAQSNDESVALQVNVQSIAGTETSTVTFSMMELQAFPAVTFETETIWTEGKQTFKGVSLAALMDHLGVTEGALEAYAVNDYVVEIPVSSAVEGGPIVAYERNGAPMSTRNKGPLWVVYPYDSDPAYKTEKVYSQSIWQLVRIVVKPEN